jgi:hypothetical protein
MGTLHSDGLRPYPFGSRYYSRYREYGNDSRKDVDGSVILNWIQDPGGGESKAGNRLSPVFVSLPNFCLRLPLIIVC